MRIAALVWADLKRDFFGAPSTLADDLAGEPVLTRTLAKLAAVDGLDGIILAASGEDLETVKALAGGVATRTVSYTAGGAPSGGTAGAGGWRERPSSTSCSIPRCSRPC